MLPMAASLLPPIQSVQFLGTCDVADAVCVVPLGGIRPLLGLLAHVMGLHGGDVDTWMVQPALHLATEGPADAVRGAESVVASFLGDRAGSCNAARHLCKNL